MNKLNNFLCEKAPKDSHTTPTDFLWKISMRGEILGSFKTIIFISVVSNKTSQKWVHLKRQQISPPGSCWIGQVVRAA